MIDFPTPVTLNTAVVGTPVVTTVNRIIPTENTDEYVLLWVLDNNGVEQVTKNGVTIISAGRLADLSVIGVVTADADVPVDLGGAIAVGGGQVDGGAEVSLDAAATPIVFNDGRQFALENPVLL